MLRAKNSETTNAKPGIKDASKRIQKPEKIGQNVKTHKIVISKKNLLFEDEFENRPKTAFEIF